MRVFQMAQVAAMALVLLSASTTQADSSVAVTGTVSVKPINRCPRHYKKYRDDHGEVWCMDSSKRSYTPENGWSVAMAEKHSHPAR